MLMKGGGRYVCLCFDDFCAESFALLEKPENYGKEKSVPMLAPFRQSRLFPNVLHGHFFTIRRHLEKIFSQISWPNHVKFMAGGGHALRFTWGRTRGMRRHIVLRRDGERFLMAWIREDKKTVEFHVADRWVYMDVDGKKYPKDSFLGSVTPAYLIHDLSGPRNALDLLLANLDRPERVTSPMGEYTWEKPGKPRP